MGNETLNNVQNLLQTNYSIKDLEVNVEVKNCLNHTAERKNHLNHFTKLSEIISSSAIYSTDNFLSIALANKGSKDFYSE